MSTFLVLLGGWRRVTLLVLWGMGGDVHVPGAVGGWGHVHVAGAVVMGPWPPNMMVTAACGRRETGASLPAVPVASPRGHFSVKNKKLAPMLERLLRLEWCCLCRTAVSCGLQTALKRGILCLPPLPPGCRGSFILNSGKVGWVCVYVYCECYTRTFKAREIPV